MDLGALVLAVTTLGSVGGVTTWWHAPAHRWRRALLAAPRTRIGDCADGALVRLTGKIVSGVPTIAPLTGRPCVFSHTTVDASVSGGWTTLACEASALPFVIDDGTGRARIDTIGALFGFATDDPAHDEHFYPSGREVDALLARHGAHRPYLGQLRAREHVRALGDRVEVIGMPTREADPDGAGRVTGYRDLPPTRLCLVSAPRRPLLVGDPR